MSSSSTSPPTAHASSASRRYRAAAPSAPKTSAAPRGRRDAGSPWPTSPFLRRRSTIIPAASSASSWSAGRDAGARTSGRDRADARVGAGARGAAARKPGVEHAVGVEQQHASPPLAAMPAFIAAA